jgi:phosphonate transport system ATP-binding protein
VFDGRGFDLTEDVARTLYGLEAGEVMDRGEPETAPVLAPVRAPIRHAEALSA